MASGDIRATVLGSKGTVKVVEAEGQRVEVRSPTFAERMKYVAALPDDDEIPKTSAALADVALKRVRAVVSLMVVCAFDEAGNRVFGEGDVESLLSTRHGPLLKGLLDATTELVNGGKKNEVGKESGETPTSSSPA